MLVLSRKKNERIVIGDNVEITIVEIRGDKVRLGISAPQSVSVHRREVYDAIKRQELGSEAISDGNSDSGSGVRGVSEAAGHQQFKNQKTISGLVETRDGAAGGDCRA